MLASKRSSPVLFLRPVFSHFPSGAKPPDHTKPDPCRGLPSRLSQLHHRQRPPRCFPNANPGLGLSLQSLAAHLEEHSPSSPTPTSLLGSGTVNAPDTHATSRRLASAHAVCAAQINLFSSSSRAHPVHILANCALGSPTAGKWGLPTALLGAPADHGARSCGCTVHPDSSPAQ